MQTVKGCPSNFAKNHAKSVLESCELFIEDDFLTPAVEATNKKIERYREYFQQHFEMTHHKTECKPIDITEIKAFLGIMYIRASLNLNLMAAGTIFSHKSITSLFQTTMSCKRCSFLYKFIEFDDLETRPQMWKEDKFACIREFFEKVNNQHAKMCIPSAHLAIDKMLYPYHGVIGTKQYNPNKPAKYGLLYHSLCDSSVQYTYFSISYAGKPDNPNELYVTGTDSYTEYLVINCKRAGGKAFLSGQKNISMDNYFSSVSIARWCWEPKITVVGTWKQGTKDYYCWDMETGDQRLLLLGHGNRGPKITIVGTWKQGTKDYYCWDMEAGEKRDAPVYA